MRNLYVLPSVAFAAALFLMCPALAQISEETESCLVCHGSEDMKEVGFEFEKRGQVPIFIPVAGFESSVHGSFDCSMCHSEFSADDHPSRTFSDRRTYSLALSESCTGCHSFEGIHGRMLETHRQIPCTDCHSAHLVQSLDRDEDPCLGCHSQTLHLELADGSPQRIQVDAQTVQTSVHGELRCVDCHFGFSAEEHPTRSFESRREMTVAFSDTCRRCHFDKYTRTLESVHYRLLSEDDAAAPSCVDCHGSHGVQSGRNDKLAAARRCENCHQEIYSVYADSVHGSALVSDHNQDVPICSDCHTAHRIGDPTQADFRNEVPQMCGSCHSNSELMSQYGLSTAVLDSYLEDFHGVTLSFYSEEKSAQRIALCADCHGIHDISTHKGSDPAEIKATLQERCSHCHEGATENFPDAWVSHYEASMTQAPLVYGVNVFYKYFIPFMMVGLLLQILLHIWRYAFNR